MRPVALLFVVASLVAVAMSAVAATGALMPGDLAIARAIQRTPAGGHVEELADAVFFARFAVFAVGVLIAVRSRDHRLLVTGVLVLAAISLNPVLKDAIDRPRPDATRLVLRESPPDSGFPSGHAMSTALIAGFILIAVAGHASRRVTMAVVVIAVMAAGLVFWDRVYTGAHWPSDVVGGATIGLTLLLIANALPRLAGGLRRRHQPSP